MELKYYTILTSPNYNNPSLLVKDWNKENYPFGFGGVNHDGTECIWAQEQEVYIKKDVDEAIAELKGCLASAEEDRDYFKNVRNERHEEEIAELKQKLENVQASMYCDVVDANMENRRLKRALWLARAERYKMREFIAREEGNLCNQMSWSQFLRERTYSQWVDQLLRIANLANKLQNKCRAKAEEYK